MKKITNSLMPLAALVLFGTCMVSAFCLLVVLMTSAGFADGVPLFYYQRLNVAVISVALPIVGMILFTAILLGLPRKSAEAAKPAVIEGAINQPMNEEGKSECADAAIDDLRMAGLPSDAQIKVLSVVENWLPPPSALEIIEHVDRDQEYLALARRGGIRLVSMEPGWDVKSESGLGSPATVIIEKADEWGADLIVVGSHGHTALG